MTYLTKDGKFYITSCVPYNYAFYEWCCYRRFLRNAPRCDGCAFYRNILFIPNSERREYRRGEIISGTFIYLNEEEEI